MPPQAKHTSTLSGIAIAISLIALIFTGLQLWVSRGQLLVSQNQLLLSMKPSVNFDTENVSDDPPVGIKVDDAGPGPAVIKSFTYYLDRKPVGSKGDDALETAGLSDSAEIINLDLEVGDTLAVNENEWLIAFKTKPRSSRQIKEIEQLADLLDKRLAIEIEFCPVLGGKCESKCSTTGMCGVNEDGTRK